MSFTDAERRKWLGEKLARERSLPSSAGEQHQTTENMEEYTVCLHCNNSFRRSEGSVTQDAAICDVCNY